jgi:hypothetical protein
MPSEKSSLGKSRAGNIEVTIAFINVKAAWLAGIKRRKKVATDGASGESPPSNNASMANVNIPIPVR